MTPIDVRSTLCIALLATVLAQGAVAVPAMDTTSPAGDAAASATAAEQNIEPAAVASLSRRLVALSTDAGRAVVETITAVVDPPALLLPAAYSRSVAEEPLANERRSHIFELIHARPGVSQSSLVAETGLATSTVRYHLGVLESAGLVQARTVLGQVRLAELGVPRVNVDLEAALSDGGTAPVLTAVAGLDGPSVSEVADELSKAPSTVSYHVERLEEAGLLERERAGRRVELRLSDRVESVPVGVALASAAPAPVADGRQVEVTACDGGPEK